MSQNLIPVEGEFGVAYALPLENTGKLKHFPVPWRGASIPTIPYFRGRPAPLANNYLRYMDNKRRKRLQIYDSETLKDAEHEYVAKLIDLEARFGHLMTRYDDEVVLKTTCALGMMRPAHFDMDEKGIFGTGRTTQYATEILEFLERDLLSRSHVPDGTISMKRGTNLGYPTPKGGRSRDESDFLLALHVAAVQGGRVRGMSLNTLNQTLEAWYGPCFAIAGERFQTTERVIPVFYSGGVTVYKNFAQRARGIYYSPKYMVAWNRRYVKTILSGIMAHPMHIQDRTELEKIMSVMTGEDYYCFSIDVSRFDQSHGIEVVKPILAMIARVCSKLGLGDEMIILDDLITEFTVPDVIPTSRDLLWEKGGQILSSGLSMTSIVGCCSSHCIAYHIAHFLSGKGWTDVDKGFGDWWRALTWGDDVVFAINKSAIDKRLEVSDEDSLLEAVGECGRTIDIKLTFEPTIKFLGKNYNMLSYSDSPKGYPVGRFIQQQFFPERAKTFPFDIIGYIARLEMLDDAIRPHVHEAMVKAWPFESPSFPYNQRFAVLQSLLPEVEKYSQSISQLDDVLGVFTHGLDPSDLDGADLGEFADLLALGSVDVTDPAEFLLSSNRNMSRELVNLVRDVSAGDVTKFHRAVEVAAPYFNSKVPLSGQLYY